jgi:hypothetical protein
MNNQYNFVFFGSNQDLYKIAYNDIIGLDYVRYVATPYHYKNAFLKLVFKLHLNPRINRYIKLPFKNIWNSGYYKHDFNNSNPICFIFFHEWTQYERFGLVKYLRKTHSHSKIVCFFQDLVHLEKNIDINHIKVVFDVVISFDHIDAKKYNIPYHPTVYSYCLFEGENNAQKSDVYFLGSAKNRLDKIGLIYQYLDSIGYKCDFYVTNVDKKDQSNYQGINYISQMSYEENLQHVLNTECILEVTQDDATGYTMRTWEAIMYNKKLLTNNIEIKYAPFYNPSNILVFDNTEGIKKELVFFNNISRNTDHKYKHEISPLKLLDFIIRKLEKSI